MEEYQPPPVKQGDWIEMKVGAIQCRWAIVRHVYELDWIEVSYFSSDGVDKNDWKWNGYSWGIFADYGIRLGDQNGLHRQRLMSGPDQEYPRINFGDTRPHTKEVVWLARREEEIR